MVSFIAKHKLAAVFQVFTVLAAIAAGAAVATFALQLVHGPAMAALGALAAVAAVAAVLTVSFKVMDQVDNLRTGELERTLSSKYGVGVEHARGGVWKIDGELRQATLHDGALLVGGKELAAA